VTISLSDIPTAVADYIKDNVTVEVSEVKHGISTVLQPHERGKFDVVVTNNGSVRLTNLVYELSISPDDVAKLVSPAGIVIVVRKSLDPDADVIQHGDEVAKMFVTPDGAVTYASVDPGASVTFPELQVSTQEVLGDATIKCSIHAAVDQESLFPEDEESPVAKQTLTVS
jgi:hypothetical protein